MAKFLLLRWVGITIDPTYTIQPVSEPPSAPATPVALGNAPQNRSDQLIGRTKYDETPDQSVR